MSQNQLNKQNAMMRVIFLLFMFGLSIGDAFNVIYVRRLAEKMVETSQIDFYINLPITGMYAMMIIGVAFAGMLARRSGGFIPFMRILRIITAAEMLVRGLAFSYWVLLAGFLIDGFGYGCIFIAIRYYAFLFDDPSQRLASLVHVNVGAFAGQCMGTILGGILAGQTHYRTVYLMAVGILVIPVLLLFFTKVEQPLKIGPLKNVFAVLKNKKAVVFMLFMVLPVYTCTVFVSYSVPLAVDSYGFSATVVSAMMLGNYIIGAYASPFMTDLVTKRISSDKACILYGAITAVMILLYSLIGGMILMLITVVVLGLADAFGFSVLMDGYNKTKGDHDYTDNDALVAFILMTRVGMAVAPTLITAVHSTVILSVVVVAGIVLFVLFGGIKKEEAQ